MKEPVSKRLCLALVAWIILLAPPSAEAFSLLGPFAPWMSPNLGYHKPGDIGGPMNLGEEYRWTVPVVTYGFDQSFLDYFGQPGVDAVEQAIQILNDLPPASEMRLSDYPLMATGFNYSAYQQNLVDLKSTVLGLLLEQVGLAQPTRYAWTIRNWDPNLFCNGPRYLLDELGVQTVDPFLTNYVCRLTFDPASQQPTRFVNEVNYTFVIGVGNQACNDVEAWEHEVDPLYAGSHAVAELDLSAGEFFTALTYDDGGGLLYLLSRTNVNVETLDDSVIASDGDATELVRTAPRPGIEKITFARHRTNAAGRFEAMTNRYDDLFLTNGTLVTQRVCRVVAQPDILFRAMDFGFSANQYWWWYSVEPWTWFRIASRPSDTSHWVNNSDLNGNPGGEGPGVIRPPIEISLHTPGHYLAATGGTLGNSGCSIWNWASFSTPSYTNVFVFPGSQTNLTSLTLATRTFVTNASPTFEWTLLGRPGRSYRIESATNLVDWSALATVTNLGGVFQFTHPLAQPHQFFRAVLEE